MANKTKDKKKGPSKPAWSAKKAGRVNYQKAKKPTRVSKEAIKKFSKEAIPAFKKVSKSSVGKKIVKAAARAIPGVGAVVLAAEAGKKVADVKGCYGKARKRGLSKSAALKFCAVDTKSAKKALKQPKIRK
tara:strand:- start:1101 stop:1493 length:393 start_codon:yes stop_codon:yes gene_type:complete